MVNKEQIQSESVKHDHKLKHVDDIKVFFRYEISFQVK